MACSVLRPYGFSHRSMVDLEMWASSAMLRTLQCMVLCVFLLRAMLTTSATRSSSWSRDCAGAVCFAYLPDTCPLFRGRHLPIVMSLNPQRLATWVLVWPSGQVSTIRAAVQCCGAGSGSGHAEKMVFFIVAEQDGGNGSTAWYERTSWNGCAQYGISNNCDIKLVDVVVIPAPNGAQTIVHGSTAVQPPVWVVHKCVR